MTGPARAPYIVAEGIDGAGKSTLLRALAARWTARGWTVRLRSEPADPALGAEAARRSGDDPMESALAFTLDRARAAPGLRADLRSPGIVLQDRSFYSTLAYQGAALPPPARAAVARLQRLVTPLPDRVLWLDVPVREALDRMERRGAPRAPLERRTTLDRVRREYGRLCRPPRWIRLDARPDPERLAERADRSLAGFLARRAPPDRPGRSG